MTREQMIAEFGEPGVENPKVIDLITVDAATGKVVLVMIERRVWGTSPQQFQQIEEKVNRYMGYVLDGFLAEHHPEHVGKPVVVRLDCVEAPIGDAVRFVRAIEHAMSEHGLEFAVNVTPPPPPAAP